VSAVAASFAVRRTQVYRWLEQLRAEGGLGHRSRGRPRRGPALPAPGSAAREVELERLVGQHRLELFFFRQALRQVGTVGRSVTGRGASPCSGSSTPGRTARKAD
jgi:transposase-like protein